jgi:hypothetical protein
MELAPKCTSVEVAKWLDAGDTLQLASFLRCRHESRFFGPIECLRRAEDTYGGYGFSMMALCCLLTETIQCYREGMPTTSGKEWRELVDIQNSEAVSAAYRLPAVIPKNGREVFAQFFGDYRSIFTNVDGSDFYDNIRNGLLHQAQTKNGWTIDAVGSVLCDPAQKRINRSLFAQALRESFEGYVRSLELALWNGSEWQKAARKIWWLIRVST